MSTSTCERLIALVSKQFKIHKRHINSETHINDDLGADQLDTLNLAIRIEESFNIHIPNEKHIALEGRIQTLVELIEHLLIVQKRSNYS
jgi:acyl carrier protein